MLAIVIPYFKINFFEATLISLANQTDKRFNVYIGDDASPDNPSLVLDKYKGNINFIYKRFDSNIGKISLAGQWKRCLDLVQKEEWVMILCDDDTLSEHCVESFFQNIVKINEGKCNVVRFATTVIDENGIVLSKVHVHPEIENSVDFLFRKIKGGTRSSLSEYVFKTVSVKKIGFRNFPLAWHTDDMAILEFSEFGNVFTINNSIVNFRLSSENITSKKDNLRTKNKATFKYYYCLLSHNKNFFGNDQKVILFGKLEKSFLNDKKNLYFWIKLIKLYAINFKVIGFVALIFKAIAMSFGSKNNIR